MSGMVQTHEMHTGLLRPAPLRVKIRNLSFCGHPFYFIIFKEIANIEPMLAWCEESWGPSEKENWGIFPEYDSQVPLYYTSYYQSMWICSEEKMAEWMLSWQ